jgi:hypothetical protein
MASGTPVLTANHKPHQPSHRMCHRELSAFERQPQMVLQVVRLVPCRRDGAYVFCAMKNMKTTSPASDCRRRRVSASRAGGSAFSSRGHIDEGWADAVFTQMSELLNMR